MPMWEKLEKRKVTEYRDGAVYKTKILKTEWFDVHSQEYPQLYHINEDNIQWCRSNEECKFQQHKPE